MADIKINVQVVEGQAKAALSGLDSQAKKVNDTFGKMNTGVKGVSVQIKKAFDGSIFESAANGVSSLIARVTSLNPILLAVSAAVGAVVAAFKFTQAGEEIKAINTQFDLMATQAGAASEELKKALVAVADGTVDTEDLLKSTNKFILEFTGNTEKIPQILELAKKATSLFGGEVTQNYEQIGQALAAGNTRALRSLGIIVDQDQAYRNFAKSIGVATSELNDAGKKQALLEEALRKGGETFKNVNPSIFQTGEAFKRLKVQIGELFDFVAINAEKAFGGTFANVLNKAASLLERFNLATQPAQTGLGGIEQQIRKTELSIESITEKLNVLKENVKIGAIAKEVAIFDINKLESDKVRLEQTLESLTQRQLKFQQDNKATTEEIKKDNSTFVDEAALAQNLANAAELKTQARIREQEAKAAEDQRITELEALELERFRQNAETELLIEQEKIFRKQGLKKQADDINKKLQEKQLKDDAKFYQQLAALDAKYQQNKVNLIQAAGNLGTALAKDGSKEQFLISKAAAIAGSIVSTNLAYAQALATPPGPPYTLGLAAQVRAIGAINTAAIVATAIKGFQDGGIVGGSSFSGDKVLARVNSGEMILNRQQQSALFNLANNGGSGGQVIEIHNIVELDGEVVGRSVSRQVANGLKLGEVV